MVLSDVMLIGVLVVGYVLVLLFVLGLNML